MSERSSVSVAIAISFAISFLLGASTTVYGQNSAVDDNGPLTFYTVCADCDVSLLQDELTFVDHVQDPDLAQIHLEIQNEVKENGDIEYTLIFTGQREFSGLSNTISYTSEASHDEVERYGALRERIKLGLVQYFVRTPYLNRISLSVDPGFEVESAPVRDPWNSWVLDLYAGGNFLTEAARSSLNLRYGGSANRITEDWRIRTQVYFNYNERNFRENGDWLRSVLHRNGARANAVKSLGPHFSAGLFTDYVTTTFDNLRHRILLSPAVEYSLFPYVQASRREITFVYRLGYGYADYIEETIYGKLNESYLNHAVEARVRVEQPWGSINAGLVGSHFFHDISHNRAEFFGRVSLRLVGGLSLNISGDLEIIHDQLSLPRGEASLEEILLQQRRLATNYFLSGSVALSYTFGSIFSNIVNPRL